MDCNNIEFDIFSTLSDVYLFSGGFVVIPTGAYAAMSWDASFTGDINLKLTIIMVSTISYCNGVMN